MRRLRFKTLIILVSLTLYEVGLCSDKVGLDMPGLDKTVESETEVFEIEYKVRARGFKVGKLETRIERNGDHFKVETHTVASRMVSLLVKGKLQDECEFRLRNDASLKPISYATQRTGKNGYKKSLEYDWPTKSIVYQDDSIYGFPSEYLLDNCNFYIAVALSQGTGAIAQPFKVLDASEHRSRGFSIESIEQQEIKTAFGMLPTTKITMNRTDSDRRRSIFWLSKEYPLSPLKVRDERDGKVTTLTLEKITSRQLQAR
ncbi:MAG: DUF3108 domain-containing protein [Arenicella sp.]|nr:DUF3108 domain-containing protein [Arenicella sp.]